MFTIRKKFKFEMAHVLSSSYSEECQQCHGHSYTLEVLIKASKLDDGMVIDFKRLKEIVNKKIIEKFDHRTIIPSEIATPTLMQIPFLKKSIQLVPYNPTAELMAFHFHKAIFKEIQREVPFMVTLTVRLHETDSGYAQYKEGVNL